MKDKKIKQSAKRERFLHDQIPVRLGNLASNLARVESISKHPALRDAASKVLTESKFFIEWTAVDASLPQQVELLELQRTLARWQLGWDKIWEDTESRSRVAAEARQWSNRLLESSGLLRT